MKQSIYEYAMDPEWSFLDKTDVIGGPFTKFNIGEPSVIFKKIGAKAAVTDFSVALGADFVGNIENRTGYYWVSYGNEGSKKVVTPEGKTNYPVSPDYAEQYVFNLCCRHCFSLSKILPLASNLRIDDNNVLKCEYGSYPQDAISNEESFILEDLFKSNKLKQKERQFTINNRAGKPLKKFYYTDYMEYFKPEMIYEYEYNGRTFTRVNAKKDCTLSNGVSYKEGEPIWIEIKPITWIIDKNNDKLFPEKLLFSGVTLTDGMKRNNIIDLFLKAFYQQIISQKEIDKYDTINFEEENLESRKTR